MREFSILIQAAPDVPGEWTAHCLNWDLVSQGRSPLHALQMIFESILTAIADDVQDHLDPADREPAPREDWDRFLSIQLSGTRIAAADVERMTRSSSFAVVAYLNVKQARVGGLPLQSVAQGLPGAPPPFMIAELEQNSSSVHC